MTPEERNRLLLIGLGCFCPFLIVGVSLLGACFVTLEPNEFGIEVNRNTQQLNIDKLFRGGRNLVGIGHEFLTYPATDYLLLFAEDAYRRRQQSGDEVPALFEGDVTVRTWDGLSMVMGVVVQMRLGLDDTIESFTRLYRLIGTENWKGLVRAVSLSTIRDVAATYNATEFYSDRQRIGNTLTDALKRMFESVEMRCKEAHVINVQFPEELEDAIQELEIRRQEQQEALYRRGALLINAETETLVSATNAEQRIIEATAEGESAYLTANNSARATTTVLQKQAEALGSVQTTLGYGNISQLLAYQWLSNMREAKGQVLFDLDLPLSLRQQQNLTLTPP
ncbi:unnamed protein product [Vitrella brassicaformis CCMP3155]|uniref:Band 7 domain-containing protein n=2 Tax=Vitrella brassicaformis TaxID=1169539 RepID=A0A0G4ETX6_VITBC|nr:unnamed protein product [Vitrella brassicaformis CCMP3155]|mmetsp:Transcript_5079/g.11890  ORF Transcript_5079/g.11890 Transcript_5079/m.11890 type:complete len:338 (+) Transcript_5079:90-1103(+)|eukprot:CEM01709.1 unnamed protein product [Vitrella brassicaformis CCMP3155]